MFEHTWVMCVVWSNFFQIFRFCINYFLLPLKLVLSWHYFKILWLELWCNSYFFSCRTCWWFWQFFSWTARCNTSRIWIFIQFNKSATRKGIQPCLLNILFMIFILLLNDKWSTGYILYVAWWPYILFDKYLKPLPKHFMFVPIKTH